MKTVITTAAKNTDAHTLPEGMTRDEAFDRLKKNLSRYPSVKAVYADPADNCNILIIKTKFNKYELGVLNSNITIRQRLSVLPAVAAIPGAVALLLGAIGFIMYLTVGVPIHWISPWVIFLVISVAIYFPVFLITNSECNKILAHVKQELEKPQ